MPFRTPRLTPTLALLLGLALAPPTEASAILAQHFESPEAFREYLAKRGLDVGADMLLLAQGRSGDNRIGGLWELGLFPADGLADGKAGVNTAQFIWPQAGDGHPWVPFALARSADAVIFSVDGITTKLALPVNAPLSALALSVGAPGKGDSAILRSLTLDGDPLRLGTINASADKRDLALVEGLSGDFTLKGEARLRWPRETDLGDPARLMFQIAGYRLADDTRLNDPGLPSMAFQVTSDPIRSPAVIPAPAIGLALLAASLGLIGHRHLRDRLPWRRHLR